MGSEIQRLNQPQPIQPGQLEPPRIPLTAPMPLAAAISCPTCHNQIASPPELAGQVVACPYCSQQFVMPGVSPQPVAVNASVMVVDSRAGHRTHHHYHHHRWFDPFADHWSYWLFSLIALVASLAFFAYLMKDAERMAEKAMDEQIKAQQEIQRQLLDSTK